MVFMKWMAILIMFAAFMSGKTTFAQSDEFIQKILSNPDNQNIVTIVDSVKWLNNHSSQRNKGYADTLFKAGFKKTGGQAPLLYQLTRYHIIYGFGSNSSGLGSKSAALALKSIRKAIALEPDNGDLYTLYGHIFSLTGQYGKAEELLNKAERLGSKSPWLKLNQGYLYEKLGKASVAGRFIKLAIEEGIDERRVLVYAWQQLERFYESDPGLDADPLVLSGKINRLTRKNFSERIRNNKGYHVVEITSYDPWCMPCIDLNKTIDNLAINNPGDITISRLSENPYENQDKKIMDKYNIIGVPSTLIFYDDKLIFKLTGVMPVSRIENSIKAHQTGE